MKSKQVWILCVVAVILLGIGISMNRSRHQDWRAGGTGAAVLPGFEITEVDRFVLHQQDGTVTVEFRDGRWRVRERQGYPAKYETLATFLETLRDLTVTQTLAVGESQYGRLKLNEPGQDDAGILLTLHNRGGEELGALVFGREHLRRSPGGDAMGMGDYPTGRYLRVKGGKEVFLVANPLATVEQKAGSWLDDTFFQIGDIRAASLEQGGETLWSASREDKSADLRLEGGIPADKEADSARLGSIKNAFSWARFHDVLAAAETDPAEIGFDQPKVFVAREFDGIAYTVTVGNKNAAGRYHLAVQAAYEGPAERTPGEDETDEDRERLDGQFAKTLQEMREKVAGLNARTEGWVYLVDSWTVDNVIKTRDELLKDKLEPETPAAPEADDEAAEAAE